MRHYSRYIILAGSIISFFCFALPWKHNYSGAVIANGNGWSVTIAFVCAIMSVIAGVYLLRLRPVVRPILIIFALFLGLIGIMFCFVTFGQVVEDGFNFVTISFLATSVLVGLSIYMFNKSSVLSSITKIGLFTSSIVGICCFLLLFFTESYIIGTNNKLDNIRYGAFFTAIGYIITIIGYTCLENPEDRSVESIKENNVQEQNTEGDGE